MKAAGRAKAPMPPQGSRNPDGDANVRELQLDTAAWAQNAAGGVVLNGAPVAE